MLSTLLLLAAIIGAAALADIRGPPVAGAQPPPVPSAPGDSYSPFGIDKTAFDLVLEKLKERHDSITALGNDTDKWRARQVEVRASLQVHEAIPTTA